MLGGQRMSALTSREMREIDRLAVEETGPGLLQMMENARRSRPAISKRSWTSSSAICTAGPSCGLGFH